MTQHTPNRLITLNDACALFGLGPEARQTLRNTLHGKHIVLTVRGKRTHLYDLADIEQARRAYTPRRVMSHDGSFCIVCGRACVDLAALDRHMEVAHADG